MKAGAVCEDEAAPVQLGANWRHRRLPLLLASLLSRFNTQNTWANFLNYCRTLYGWNKPLARSAQRVSVIHQLERTIE